MWCDTPTETFFHCSKQLLNSSILMPFSASAMFFSASSTLAKHFPLRTFFIWGNQKSLLGQDWEGGAWESCLFLVKNCWTLGAVWAGILVNHPSWNGQTHWKSSKKITEAKHNLSQHHQRAHWYISILELSLSGGSLCYKGPILQKIIPGFLGSPLVCVL